MKRVERLAGSRSRDTTLTWVAVRHEVDEGD
jgi:hypothetical protein